MNLKKQIQFYTRTLLIFFLFSITFSCGQRFGKDKNQDSTQPELKLTPTELLIGEWSGFFNAQDDGKIIGNGTTVKVNFQESGTFEIFLDHSKQIAVSGNWKEFQGKSLFLSIINSAAPRIGSAGDNIEASYNLIPSGLSISHLNFLIRVQKEQLASAPHENGNWYAGSWNCDGESGRSSKISISESGDFSLSSQKESERPFIASGKVQFPSSESDKKWTLKLSPTTYSSPIPQGSFFEFSQSNEKIFPLYFKNSSKSVLIGTCHK